ncbi:hypothetical protein Back11_20480 [Paenibacillus baekrokdamisoli]|uniref:Uncharacterized protein n=1 Tax=Paenibacillus baekrokdamisoli TaxID=1712516 RepID=A0A3G9J770_9BACL|nr:PepSY domain-containing protein [Paenibacillus baekrokdamisoli]MBB3069944.1 putative membrane protein YkoI [Paenibacillus baekrokdamisoli]BBH20703.1 hypothetical protein Back11_20480 [Paenibacillus baekrokdamisoli]
MNKKLMIAALAVTLIGGGIAGSALLPSANADSQTKQVTQSTTTQPDTDKEVADDQAGQANTDKEVADDQAGQANTDKEVADDQAGKADTDKEVADDQAGKANTDKEVADDQAGQAGQAGQADTDKEVADDQSANAAPSAAAITKEQSIELAKKQYPGGTVKTAKLESENGKSAYAITITDAKGTEHEITIDAAGGTVIPEND